MRIQSKFQDYYDCGQAYGVDTDLVYIRETDTDTKAVSNGDNSRESKLKYNRVGRRLKGLDHLSSRYWCKQNFLHFCGKVYPFYSIHFKKPKIKNPKTIQDYEEWYEYAWSEEKAKEYFNQHSKYDFFHSESEKADEWKVREYNEVNKRYNSPVVFEFFDAEDYDGLHRNREILYVVNPCLKDFDFKQVFDPYQAYQEISMFVAMLQNPEDKDLNPAATDKEKIVNHGMDEKYGFRKTPEVKDQK